MFNTHTAIADARAVSDPGIRLDLITGLMAAFMVDRTATCGACTEDDLAAAGFSPDEIIELHVAAAKSAAQLMLRRVERPRPMSPEEAIHGLGRLVDLVKGLRLRDGGRTVERAAEALAVLTRHVEHRAAA